MIEHCLNCTGWAYNSIYDEGHECAGFDFSELEQLRAERDAWKTLHDAKGTLIPYSYASQEQLQKIKDAKKVLNR